MGYDLESYIRKIPESRKKQVIKTVNRRRKKEKDDLRNKHEQRLFSNLDYLFDPRKRPKPSINQSIWCSTQCTFNFDYNRGVENFDFNQNNNLFNQDSFMDLKEKSNLLNN